MKYQTFRNGLFKNGMIVGVSEGDAQALFPIANALLYVPNIDDKKKELVKAVASDSSAVLKKGIDSVVLLEAKRLGIKGTVEIADNSSNVYSLDLETQKKEQIKESSLDQLVGDKIQFGVVSGKSARALYHSDAALSVMPGEYSDSKGRFSSKKNDINTKIHSVAVRALKRGRKDMVEKLMKDYLSLQYELFDATEWAVKLKAIDWRLGGAKAAAAGKHKHADLIIELGRDVEDGYLRERREELAHNVGKIFQYSNKTFNHAHAFSMRAASSEAEKILECFGKETSHLAMKGAFAGASPFVKVRRAHTYMIPERLYHEQGHRDRLLQYMPEEHLKNLHKGIIGSYSHKLDRRAKDWTDWNLINIGVDKLSKRISGQASVAVIDTGVDYNHPALKHLFGGIKGYDFVDNDNEPMDENEHGTHVAGIIGGYADGTRIGVNISNCSLYAVRVLDANGAGSETDVLYGIEWCIDNDISIANMSLGSSAYSDVEAEVCRAAIENGVMIVAAAGNESYGPSYPASLDGVMSVAAVDINNERAEFSNVWDTNDISAPGVEIFSSIPKGEYARFSGTSMATPHIAGVASLLSAYLNERNPEKFINLIKDTATKLGKEEEYGAGLVRIDRLFENI